MKNKSTPPKERNWIAVAAHQRLGGPMVDRKKEQNKRACRGNNWKRAD